ncbi:amino acid adenylation domain-containing protein [Pseudoalteromonas sp. T1lg65]|uniref:amino acid adenylation domain-containing protein n=1 Tax=Pseudoalteromonas sp. T1lg65 TaxID=2077101 RepID=UPI003F78D6AB
MTHERVPLTLSQRDIFFDQLNQMHSPIYNIGGYIRCQSIDVDRLKEAHAKLVKEHESFGLRIIEEQGDVVQYIASTKNTELPYIDFRSELAPQASAEQWLENCFKTVLPIFDSQLCFGYLLQISDQEFWYVGLSHHLAMDGWGFLNWSFKLAELYNNINSGCDDGLSYAEMSDADQEYLSSNRYLRDREFWQQQNVITENRLLSPQYHGSASCQHQAATSTRYRHQLDRSWFEQCESLCSRFRIGMPQFMMSLLSFYFSGLTNQQHLVLGVPAHNRKNFRQKKTLGVFTSMTPVPVEIESEDTFLSLSKRIGGYQKTCFRHQKFPNSDMYRLFETDHSFYDLSFNYLKFDYQELQFDGAAAKVIYQTSGVEKTPLTVTIWDGGDEQIELQLDYNHAYFSAPEIELLASRLNFLMQYFTEVSNWDKPLSQCALVTPNEASNLVNACNLDALPLSGLQLHQHFERVAESSPEAIAISHHGKQYSYQLINGLANKLANLLSAKFSSGEEESIVGICQNRGVDMVISILAVFKAGMSYVPLDPTYPQDRIDAILADAKPMLVLCHASTKQKITKKCLVIDGLSEQKLSILSDYSSAHTPANNASLNSLAYLIYTSGSTGVPKGVAIEHGNASAMVDWAVQQFSNDELSKVLFSTSLNFDLSIFEMFAPLSVGGCIEVVDNALALNTSMSDITLINTVPSAIKALLANNAIPSSVKVINLAGEALQGEVVNSIFAQTQVSKVYNLYGPSEDTTYSTVALFTQPLSDEPHIGKVIPNSQGYVLNSALQLLPEGAAGELYLAGKGVARGYLNKPELTEQSFLPNPFVSLSGSPTLYKTGDLVRLRKNGVLEYLGRIDDQVKIRGHRIELGEVQAHLQQHQMVRSNVVIAKEVAGSKQLVAYIQSVEPAIDEQVMITEIKSSLEHSLPSYMIPSFFIFVELWPLTANGKINKQRLPAPQLTQNAENYLPPQSENERYLVTLWAELLELQPQLISVDADFFTLGGHSILAMRLVSEIRQQLNLEVGISSVFSHSKLSDLASYLDGLEPISTIPQITPIYGSQPYYVTSSAQHRLWLLDSMQEGSREYNMCKAFVVTGQLCLHALRQALTTIIARHSVLRTVYQEVDGVAMQRVQSMDALEVEIVEHTLDVDDEHEKKEALRLLLSELSNHCFDLSNELMIKVDYVHLLTDQGVLHFNVHHIAADGWSIEILIDELTTCYQAYLQGEEPNLLPLPVQYVDYAQWQRDHLAEHLLDEQLQYWKQQLRGIPSEHSLPLKQTRPNVRCFIGETVKARGGEVLANSVVQLAKQQRLTSYMLLHSALALVLARFSNTNDIIIGTPITQRPHKTLESLIGFFINTMVLRVNTQHTSVASYLQHVKQTLLDAQANKDVPFEYLVEQLNVARAQSHSPLFQIMLTTNDNFGVNRDHSIESLRLGEASLEPYCAEVNAIKFDLEFNVQLSNQHIEITANFDADIFEPMLIEQICTSTLETLAELTREQTHLTELSTKDLRVISAEQQQKLLHISQGQQIAIQQSDHFVTLFEQQVNCHPNKAAVYCGQESITYAELNSRASKLAAYLIEEYQLKPESLVALYMPRSIEMIIALLAVVKAGGAFIPIDVNYPHDRVNMILEDAQPTVTLVEHGNFAEPPLDFVTLSVAAAESYCRNYAPDSLLPVRHSLDDLAYVIYTSGTTGRPKGVMVEHRGLTNIVKDTAAFLDFNSQNCFYQSTAFGFDAAILVIAVPLTVGGTLQLASSMDFQQELRATDRVSHILMTPSMLDSLNPEQLPHITHVMAGGEACSPELSKVWLAAGKQFFNGYGPTETSICSTVQRAKEGCLLTIGRPVANTQAVVLGNAHELLPIGCIGELYIGGVGLARGYLNLPELTAERFITPPFVQSEPTQKTQLFYRTGDRVRYLNNGEIEFLGRLDDQIKLRGFRIELAEIQTRILQHPQIESCLVTLKTLGNVEQLIAYCQLNASEHSQVVIFEEVKSSLKVSLPEYMLPSAFIAIESWPLSSNGKIDKALLPVPEKLALDQNVVAPVTETEHMLCEICAQLLGRPKEQICVVTNFFELGGHSLLMLKLKTQIESTFAITLTFKDVADEETIQAIASLIDIKMMQSQLASNNEVSNHEVEVMDW